MLEADYVGSRQPFARNLTPVPTLPNALFIAALSDSISWLSSAKVFVVLYACLEGEAKAHDQI